MIETRFNKLTLLMSTKKNHIIEKPRFLVHEQYIAIRRFVCSESKKKNVHVIKHIIQM